MQAEQQSERERFEVELIEQTALRVGMKSLMNNGAASCVYSEGCNGVSQEHLIAFAREVALHCVAALSHPGTPQGWQPIETCPHDGEVVDFWIPDGGTARARADDYWAGAHWLKAASHWSRLLSPPEQGGKG